MSSVEVLPLHSDDHDASAASSILTLVGPETATTGHEYGNLRTPRPARSRTYERGLVTILSRLLQPADFGAGATDRSDLLVETQSLETEEEDYESLFLVAAALLGARRMTQAADLLQRLDTIAAPRGNRQRWRARTEFYGPSTPNRALIFPPSWSTPRRQGGSSKQPLSVRRTSMNPGNATSYRPLTRSFASSYLSWPLERRVGWESHTEPNPYWRTGTAAWRRPNYVNPPRWRSWPVRRVG